MTKHANGAASGARGDTIAPGVVSEYPPVNEGDVGAVTRLCPICHGSGRVDYDVISLPCAPIRCKCCKGTGRQLWQLPTSAQTEAGVKGGCISSSLGHVAEKTLIALRSPSYSAYCQACIDAGFEPSRAPAWYRTRNNYRSHPERVAANPGESRQR